MAPRRLPAHVRAAIERAEAEDARPRAGRMSLVLPFPPSVNNLYATVRLKSGRIGRAKTEAAKHYAEQVGTIVGLWLNSHGARPPLPPYRLVLRAFPPVDGQKHDLTNCFKAPEDALMRAIGGDDDDVQYVEATKMPRDHHPRLEVTLEGSTE
jgi:Holliday junction resolvase RusA-like endonuclease